MNLKVNPGGKYVVGVDLGGTNIRAVLADIEGNLLCEARRSTPAHEAGSATVAKVAEAVEEALNSRGVSAAEVTGIGMGIPGIMDPEQGVVFWSPNFSGWRPEGEPIGVGVANATGLATFIINDARCAALGELRFGAGRGAKYMIMITLGTGIGGGIVLDGKVMLGPQGSIGEVGHHTVDPNGPRCGCGNFGCWEALANIKSIVDRCLRKLQAGRESSVTTLVGGDWSKITPAVIDKAADGGDAVAREVMDETGFWVGVGVSNLINILNPEIFVIGGGVAQAGDTLFDSVRRTVAARAVKLQASHCRIVSAELGDEAGVKGGIAMVLDRLHGAA